MSFDTEVDSLLHKITSHGTKKDVRWHTCNAIEQTWQGYDKESAAVYFVSIRDEFDALKRVIQNISGSLILVQCGNKHDVSVTMSVTRKLLGETTAKLQAVRVPSGLLHHHKRLTDTLHALNGLFTDYQLDRDLHYLSKGQIEEILKILQLSYDRMKQAGTFSLGLGMIAPESSCACGMH